MAVSGTARVVVLLVYSLHNAWNCWVFLNFANYAPVERLLRVGEPEVGFINTAGFLGILITLPLVTICRRRRLLLFLAGLLNTAAAVIRYFAAVQGNYLVVVASNLFSGAAFGVLGAWPPLLAAAWPVKRRTVVTAVASLSNYVGGAVGGFCIPLVAADSAALLRLLWWQVWAATVLTALMVSWLWIPPTHPQLQASPPSITLQLLELPPQSGQLALWEELKLCASQRSIMIFGLLVGLSVQMQGCANLILGGVGFSPLAAGVGNSVYQLSAALVGMVVASQ
eukprot:gene9188-10888_t